MTELVVRISKKLFGNKIVIKLKGREYMHGYNHLCRILQLLKEFYKVSWGDVAVFKSLYAVLEERLQMEKELNCIYSYFNSPGHEHIRGEEAKNLKARERELLKELGRPCLRPHPE